MLEKIRTEYLKNKIILEIKSQDRKLLQSNVGYLLKEGHSHDDIVEIICFCNGWDRNRTYQEIKWIIPADKYKESQKNCVKEKEIIKENTPLFNKAKRSEANIIVKRTIDPVITKFRYDQIPLNDKNKSFFRGADIIAYGYKNDLGVENYNLYNNFKYVYDPLRIPVYRSLKGVDHVLFVVDIDRKQHDNSLLKAKNYMLSLKNFWEWDIIKFSGSEGYHMIKYLPKETTVDDLKQISLRVDPTKSKIDQCLFNDLNWKIRGYCVNLKTGFMSEDFF